MKNYKIGIIGYGGFGKFLHLWWDKLENVQVVAIADSKVELQEVANCQVYRHWEELIASADVDIVSIVTPPSVHAEIAVAAMRAGKHVMLEKPVAISAAQVNDILKAKEETGRSIMVNHMLRYNPIVKQLRDISLGGNLGELRHAIVTNYAQDASLPSEHWFWNRDFSGGILIEHGVHFFDIINSLTTQTAEKITGTSHWRNEHQEDQVSATVLYNQGLIAQHYHAFSGPGFFEQTSIRLHFDLAHIEIKGWIPMSGTLTALINKETSNTFNALPGWQIKNVAKIGDANKLTLESRSQLINAGGISYHVNEEINGSFELAATKSDIYGKCVQDILTDLIACIEDENHKPSISIEDAIASLQIAIAATTNK